MKGSNTEYADYVREQLTSEQWKRVLDYEKQSGDELNLDLSHFHKVICQASDLDKRIKVETLFILDRLLKDSKHTIFNDPIEYTMNHSPLANAYIRSKRFFDSCLGSGATSIGLKEYNVDNVVSNDVDKDLIKHSRETAKSRHLDLIVTKCDWRELDKTFENNSFDVITNTGNSLTYLFKKEDQMKTLKNFYDMLDHNGLLVIDRRNYDEILKGNFSNKGKGPYVGIQNIGVKPVYTNNDLLIMKYTVPEYSCNLILYPFRDGEIEGILSDVGFKDIKTFGDYKAEYDPKDVEFYTYVAKKK